MNPTFIKHDGGRALSGFRGDTGDCVTRAVAIASQVPYADVYARVQAESKAERKQRGTGRRSNARTGVFTNRVWFKRYMIELGFEWTPTMGIGTGCTTHITPGELPPTGRHVLSLSRHCAAWVNGVLFDMYDCSRDGTRCVYGYWTLTNR